MDKHLKRNECEYRQDLYYKVITHPIIDDNSIDIFNNSIIDKSFLKRNCRPKSTPNRQAIDDGRYKECTFHPQIRKFSFTKAEYYIPIYKRKINNNNVKVVKENKVEIKKNRSTIDFYKKSKEWKRKVDEKIEAKRDLYSKEFQSEYTFSPKTNSKPKLSINSRIDIKNFDVLKKRVEKAQELKESKVKVYGSNWKKQITIPKGPKLHTMIRSNRK